AENYSDVNNDLVPGDLVMLANDGTTDGVVRASGPGQVMGVVSTDPGILLSGIDESGSTNLINPKPIALSGRIPTNVTTENGPIEPGDYLTASLTTPGYAMKATGPGYVIGRALAAYTDSTPGQVMMLVGDTYYAGPDQSSIVQNGGNAILSGLTVGGMALFSDLNTSGTATFNNLVVTTATVQTLNVTGTATLANLVVSGDAQVNGNITLSGHIITNGAQPTATTQAAAGTQATVTINGTDTTGTITITTGSNPTPGALADIVFSKAYGAVPHVVISASNNNAANSVYTAVGQSPDKFVVEVLDALAPNTTYQYDYFTGIYKY
ncbi:MAG: hypothetical protein ACHQT9_02080, partial [Candidatus Saccharimonadales bacterium]